MRIKIIGENNCARAIRHLLRQAGFAVTEFLPAEVITQAPHSGYAITIDLAPAPHTPSGRTLGGNPDPTSKPDHSTHGQPAPANGEASPAHGDASLPTALCSVGGIAAEAQDDATGRIHFDSVDCALEAAVLRHVTQLAVTPVVVDRPGGVVHSERELRIVIPRSDNAKDDEAAAVAVEFGVLRGLLDLTSPPAREVSEDKSSQDASGGRKKWWTFGIVLLTGSLLALTGSLQASPRRVVEGRGTDGAFLHLEAALSPAQGQFGTGQMNLALIGGAAVSSSLYDSGNTALKVNCVVGCGAASGFSDNAAFTAGSTAVNNFSAVFNDSIAALTSGNAGAVRSTSDRMLYVNLGKLGGTALSGANVVDSGNTAFRVNCVVGCSASAGFTDNSAFTAGTTSESNVGGVFNDGLSTLSSGNAAAARITASRALHVNLRNASGAEIGTASNPVRTDPTGTTTQPVSGTFWQTTQPVSGTFWQTTQPVSIATMPSTPVTGTFYQTTQPVSIASMPSTAVTNVGTFAVQAAATVADGAEVTLGAKADAKSTATDTTAVSIMQVLKQISASVQAPPSQAVTGTFWQATQPVSIATMPSTPVTGTFYQTTQPVSGTFWQATQPVSIASMPSTPVTGTFYQTTQPVSCTGANCSVKQTDGTNTQIIDPCKGQAKVYTLISVTTGTQLITGTSAKKQYICAIQLVSATAQNIALVEGTGTVCATSTLGLAGGASAATGWNLAANGGLTFGNGDSSIGATTVNANNVCILTSSSGQISGSITSVVQ